METKGLLKNIKNLKKCTVVFIVCFFIGIIAAVAALIYYIMVIGIGNSLTASYGNMRGGSVQITPAEGMILASGVTNAGITEESFDVENLTAALTIEEVYAAAEDVIEKGSKVLKLSEESIEKARKELQKKSREADLAYRSGVIEYEQKKITAKYEKDSAVLQGEQAKEVYEETTADLSDAVEKAQKELSDAKEDIAEYQTYVNDNGYKTYYKVDQYQEDYDNTLAALKAKIEEWGVSWAQVTGGGGNEAFAKGNGPTSDQIQTLQSLYKVLEKQLQSLEQAKSEYETAVLNDAFQLQTLELSLPTLEKAVTEAQKEYENQILQAKLTYEKSLAGAQSAESDYETALKQAETKLESLQKAKKDAEENLALFESRAGDGYIYASESGTVLRMMLREEEELTSEAVIFEYSNKEEMTVSVSVDQTDISKIALGDSAYVQSEEYGLLEGVVTKINPVSGSEGRTNVTYSVTVRLIGESAEIPANQSVAVIFGADAETIQNMMNVQSGNTRSGNTQFGQEGRENETNNRKRE